VTHAGHELVARTSGDVVVRDGCVHWHTRPACDVRDAREGAVAYSAGLRDVWASRLLPCPSCAGGQAMLAAALWGPLTRVERARLPLPTLQDLTSGVTIVPAPAPTPSAGRLPAAVPSAAVGGQESAPASASSR